MRDCALDKEVEAFLKRCRITKDFERRIMKIALALVASMALLFFSFLGVITLADVDYTSSDGLCWTIPHEPRLCLKKK